MCSLLFRQGEWGDGAFGGEHRRLAVVATLALWRAAPVDPVTALRAD
jgi:hypothetical protein